MQQMTTTATVAQTTAKITTMIMMDSQIPLTSARYRKEQRLKVGLRAALTSIRTDGLTLWMISYKTKHSGAMETATGLEIIHLVQTQMTVHSSLVTQQKIALDVSTQMVTGTPIQNQLGQLLWVQMHSSMSQASGLMLTGMATEIISME